MKLMAYDEVLEYLQSKKRQSHLLLGNGFSIAYDTKIFSYNALHGFIEKLDNELLSKLFTIIKTKNFELIMQQLENFGELIDAFGTDNNLKDKVEEANSLLKHALIGAIKELHPEHVFTIPDEKSASCAKFLSYYFQGNGNIFTTNYDILLYWVLMRNALKNHVDGFGRDLKNPGVFVPEDEMEFSELRWGKYKDKQNVHYLHGALPLFDTGIDVIKEEYDSSNYLLENIATRLDKQEYPIFVTSGDGEDKLTHIMHNKYLSYCYEQLSNIQGSLITFGFNFGPSDNHIIDAINVAAKHGQKCGDKLFSVYIGVYSEENKSYIEASAGRFKCKVNMYDAKTANVWAQ